MLDLRRSEGLPAFLSPRPGVNSGFMITHYTAAALAEENRRPRTRQAQARYRHRPCKKITTRWAGARPQPRRLLGNVASILAVEAACAAQALDLHSPRSQAKQPAPSSGASGKISRSSSATPLWPRT